MKAKCYIYDENVSSPFVVRIFGWLFSFVEKLEKIEHSEHILSVDNDFIDTAWYEKRTGKLTYHYASENYSENLFRIGKIAFGFYTL